MQLWLALNFDSNFIVLFNLNELEHFKNPEKEVVRFLGCFTITPIYDLPFIYLT